MNPKGVRVESLDASVARKTGIRLGDRLLRINGHPIEDELDYRFHAGGDGAELEVRGAQAGKRRFLHLDRECASSIVLAPMRAARCRNRCLFCFVDQLPDGLRRSLYVKDEDYRFSFLYGNYVTLASAREEELDRVRRLRLQPLYVSVHATERQVRDFLLGRNQSRDILQTLRVLADAGITLHTQVVLCPGINDGKVLDRTIHDLAGLYPSVASIAIVPVGLTRYRKERGLWPLRRVRKNEAQVLVNKISKLQRLFKVQHNDHFVFLADEFYLMADYPFPPAHVYQDFPQWENGVGMIPLFCRQWERRKHRRTAWKMARSPDFLIPTGELAYPFILPYLEWLGAALGASLRAVVVRNRFFGRSVTVAGLITGRDVVGEVRPHLRPGSILLVPDVMLSREGNRFLDDLSLGEIAEALSVRVEKFVPDPAGFEKVLKEAHRGIVKNN